MNTTRTHLPALENCRRMALAGFERTLAMHCGVIRPAYLPLAESLRLFDGLIAAPAAGYASGRLPGPLMADLLRQAQARFKPAACVVFLYNSWFMGGIEMALPTFWAKAMDLLEFDGDVVFAVTRDGSQGVMLDLDPCTSRWPGAGNYELFAWGSDWPVLAPPSLWSCAGPAWQGASRDGALWTAAGAPPPGLPRSNQVLL